MLLFHGTSKESAKKILSNGFKAFYCSDWGKAAYFSDNREWANEYAHKDGVIIEAKFTGTMLDLSIPENFNIYRQLSRPEHMKYDAIKDGHIIAVYNTKKIIINNYLPTL